MNVKDAIEFFAGKKKEIIEAKALMRQVEKAEEAIKSSISRDATSKIVSYKGQPLLDIEISDPIPQHAFLPNKNALARAWRNEETRNRLIALGVCPTFEIPSYAESARYAVLQIVEDAFIQKKDVRPRISIKVIP